MHAGQGDGEEQLTTNHCVVSSITGRGVCVCVCVCVRAHARVRVCAFACVRICKGVQNWFCFKADAGPECTVPL